MWWLGQSASLERNETEAKAGVEIPEVAASLSATLATKLQWILFCHDLPTFLFRKTRKKIFLLLLSCPFLTMYKVLTAERSDWTGQEREKIHPVPLQHTLREPQFPVWSMATGVNTSLCSRKLLFTLQVLMSRLQFSRLGTFKPDRTLWDNKHRYMFCASVIFQGSGGQTDGLSDLWPTGPTHTAHREAQRSHQDECELDSADMELKKKGTRVGTGSLEAAEFYFCAQNKLFHTAVSGASGNGTWWKNQQHWVSSHLSTNNSTLGIRRTRACRFNRNTTWKQVFLNLITWPLVS